MTTRGLRAGGVALVTALLWSLVACGTPSAPSDQVSGLGPALDRVDEAAVSGDDARLRDAVAELVDITTRAREQGDLAPAEAGPILEAARALADATKGPPEPTTPPTTPATSTTEVPSEPVETTPEESDDHPPKDEKDKDNKEKEKKPKKH